MKVPDQKRLSLYVNTTFKLFKSWMADTRELQKLIDTFSILDMSDEKMRRKIYEKFLPFVHKVLKEKGLDTTAKKKASIDQISPAIVSGIKNSHELVQLVNTKRIRNVKDDLIDIQDGYEKLHTLIQEDIELPLIRKAIWKQIQQLRNKLVDILDKVLKH